MPCDPKQAGAASAEALARRQALGRLPGDGLAVAGKGSSSKAAEPLPPRPPLPAGPCCTSLPLGRHPSGPVSFGERAQAALLQSRPPLPKAPAAQGPEPSPKLSQGCSPQQRPGEERAELSRSSARGCPDTPAQCLRQVPGDGLCRRAAGISRVPWPGPRAGTSSSTAGVGPGGSEGLSASFPSPTAAALHIALVSFPTTSPASPALGSACATLQLRPPEGTNPARTYPFSVSLPALLLDGALGAPCDFWGAFLCLMLGRKQALRQSYGPSFSPRSFACPRHNHSGKSSEPIPVRSTPATGTQTPGQRELLPARQSWPRVPRGRARP